MAQDPNRSALKPAAIGVAGKEGAGDRSSEAHRPHLGHMHVHGPGCGHEAVAHETHTDYVHDGHRHARHDQHYDEH
jgi:hypothetical protein